MLAQLSQNNVEAIRKNLNGVGAVLNWLKISGDSCVWGFSHYAQYVLLDIRDFFNPNSDSLNRILVGILYSSIKALTEGIFVKNNDAKKLVSKLK